MGVPSDSCAEPYLFMETVLIDIADESMRARDFYFRTQTVSHYEKASWFRCVILKQHE